MARAVIPFYRTPDQRAAAGDGGAVHEGGTLGEAVSGAEAARTATATGDGGTHLEGVALKRPPRCRRPDTELDPGEVLVCRLVAAAALFHRRHEVRDGDFPLPCALALAPPVEPAAVAIEVPGVVPRVVADVAPAGEHRAVQFDVDAQDPASNAAVSVQPQLHLGQLSQPVGACQAAEPVLDDWQAPREPRHEQLLDGRVILPQQAHGRVKLLGVAEHCHRTRSRERRALNL